MRNKFFNAFVIALILFQAVAPVGVLAYTASDQSDYAPGSTVYISGDNSDNAGFVAEETVHVEVSGPNGFASSCSAVADVNAAWVCELTLPASVADGSYNYVATGELSAVSQSGSFTVTSPFTPTEGPTQSPTQEPTQVPPQESTQVPTIEPTTSPVVELTQSPTVEPTSVATEELTVVPTVQATSAPAPFIRSDKDDYFAGEVVTLTSGNWQAGETVQLFVNDSAIEQTWSHSAAVQADGSGAFVYQFTLPNWYVANYRVTGLGTTSGTVTWDFTDSKPNTVTIGAQSPAAIIPGGSATFNITVNFNGNNNSCTSPLSISSILPAGVTASFSPSSVTSTGGNATSTLTLNTTSLTPVGSLNFTVLAGNGGGTCQGGTAVNSSSLAVTKHVGSVTVSAQSGPLTYATAGSATYTVTVNRNTGSTGSFSVNLSQTATLPTGATASFGSSTLNFTGSDSSKSTTLTINTTSATPAGSTTITVQAVNASLSGDNASGNGTLLVDKKNVTPSVVASNKVYDGTNTASVTCSLNGVVAGDVVNVTCSAASATFSDANVANGKTVNASGITLSGSKSANYQLTATTASATANITPAPSTTTVSCPASQAYTGVAIEPCTAEATGVGLLSPIALVVTYADNVVVGTATANASWAGDDNHNSSSASKNFLITKAGSVTTVICPASVTYTGSALEPCTASVTGAGNLNQVLTVSYSDNTDVGTANASASFAGDANHSASTDSKTFAIDKAASTVTFTCPDSQVYTGAAIEPCTAEATGAGLSPIALPVTYANNVVVGTATANASWAGDANHTGNVGSDTFDITKATSTVTVTCPTNVTYTGSALTPCTASVTGAGSLNQTLTVSYTNNVNAGTATASASYAGDANHTGNSNSEEFTIDQASSTTVVTCDAGPFVYDGSAQEPCSVSITGAGGLNMSPDPDYTNNINAGIATASYTFLGDANHMGSSDSKTFTIDQAASVTDVTCPSGPFTYDGSAQTPCSVSVTGAGGLNLSPDPNYTNNVNAGTATASYTYGGDANHTDSSDSDTFAIGQATSTTLVTCEAGPFVYSGLAYEPCSVSVTGAGGLNLTPNPDYANNINAGTATASYEFAGDANHTGSNDSETFSIDKATSTTVVTCEAGPFTYNGSAQTPCSVSVTGAGGLDLTPDPVYADNVNAGTATASYTFAGDDNHTGSSDTVTFAIGQATSTTVVTCEAGPFTFDGTAQEPCSVSVTGAGGLNLTPDPDYEDNVNAGTATASYTFVGDANHTGSSDSKTFTIDKAGSVTLVSCDAGPFTYSGSAQTPCSVSVTGAGGLNLNPTPAYANNVNAGTATASYTFAGDDNHTGSSDFETFTIDKAASVTAVTCPANVTYTGSALEPCTAHVTGVGGLDEVLPVSYGNNTDAGTATASASYTGDDNHLSSDDSKIFTIDKADSVTVVTCPANVIYTGAALEPCTAHVTGVGGLDEVLIVSYNNNTNAGTATASASYDGDDNHNASDDSKTFTIDKAASVTTVTCPANVTYTGAALEPCTANVTGAGSLSQALTVSYTNNTNAGLATASASYTGDANHNDSNDSKTFTIDKAASTTTVTCPVSQVYSGSAIEPCTAEVTGVGSLSQSLTVTYVGNIVVGTATASASYTGDVNHNGSADSETFEITKVVSIVTVICPASQVYTGSAIQPCTAEATGAGMLPVDVSASLSYTDNVLVGTATADASWAGDANHFGSAGSETFEITKASSTVTVTCPASQVYTGSEIEPCSAEATGAGMSPVDVTASLAYTANVNVGTATANANWAGDANHDGSTGSATFAITKAPSVTIVTCDAGPFVYNGSAFTPCSAAVTGAGALNTVLTVSYTDNINAGPATASASYAGDANHSGSSDSETFTIDKAASTTTITCPANVTYTGVALTPCTAVATGAGGLNESLTVNYTNNTDAGTATANASFAGDANHNISSDSKTFTIDKAASTTTVTCPASVTYTGVALTPCTANVTGVGGLSQSLTVSYTDNVIAGTATANASYGGDANHNSSNDNKTFTIDKAVSVTVVTCAAGPFIYNGSAQTTCSANVTGAGGLNIILTVSYTDNVNAGTATASASYAGDANHSASSDSKNFTIGKAPSTVTVTCPATVYFTGTPQTPCSAIVTGVGGLNQSLTVTYTNNILVGTATASANYAGDVNHLPGMGSKNFSILAWTLKGFYQPVDMNGVFNTVKSGSTVPLKFELFSGSATELTDVGAVKSLTYGVIACTASAPLDEIETVATGNTVLRYDSTSGQFIYNWKTSGAAGTCYRVTMTTQDGSSLMAYFKLK